MKKDSLLYQILLLSLLCASVYLGFRFLLPLVFPFLLAYILMRMLFPIMNYLHRTCNWPRPVAHYGVLFAFFSVVSFAVIFLIGRIIAQLRLFITNFPVYYQLIAGTLMKQTTHICQCIDYYLRLESGTSLLFLNDQMQQLEEKGVSLLSGHAGKTILQGLLSSFHILAIILIVAISMIILVKEMKPINEAYRKSRYYQPVHSVLLQLKKSGLTYLRTELLILFANAAVCSFGLFLIHNPYFFIIGMGIAVFDAFPVLGSGFILLPWCLFALIRHHYYDAAILITTYLATLFIREYAEAKLLGKGMGISPFFTIAAIFTGLELFGVAGIFLGPFAIVLLRALWAECKKTNVLSS